MTLLAVPALLNQQSSGLWVPVGSPFLWIDSDDAADFTFSSGTLVSQWNDRSGNGRHFTQGTASRQPSRNGSQNSRTTVVNDGSNDAMQTASLVGGSSFTWHVVCPPSSGTQDYLLLHEGSGQMAIISKYDPGSGVKSYEFYGSTGGRCTIGAGSETGWHVITVRRNGTAIDTRIDGSASNSTTLGSNSNTSSAYTLGAADLVGTGSAATAFGTVLIYNSYLSDSDCGINEAGLKARWGTP